MRLGNFNDLYEDKNFIYVNNNINNSIEIKNNTQKVIEEEIILSKACMNLSEWSELKTHFNKIYSFFKSENNAIYDKNIFNEIDDLTNLYLGKKSEINEDDKNENEINIYLKKTGLNRNTFYPGADIFNENNISFDIIKNDCSNNNKFNEMDLGKKSGFPNM